MARKINLVRFLSQRNKMMSLLRSISVIVALVLICPGGILHAQTLTQVSDVVVSSSPHQSASYGVHTEVDPMSGKVVHVWTQTDGGGTRDVYCAIYDENQNVLVNPFRVNSITTGDQMHARCKINAFDNSFVVVWAGTNSSYFDVYCKKIGLDVTNANSSSYTAITDLVVNTNQTYQNQTEPRATFDYTRNEVLIGFTSDNSTTAKEIYFRRLNYLTGNPLSSPLTSSCYAAVEQQVNNATTGDQVLGDMDYNQSLDELLFVYQSAAVPANGIDVYRRTFAWSYGSSVWSAGTETAVNTYTTNEQTNPTLSVNKRNGNYVILWQSNGQDGSGYGIYARTYTQTHTQINSEFRINSITADDQITPRAVWDERLNLFLVYFNQVVAGVSTLNATVCYYSSSNTYAKFSNTNAITGPPNLGSGTIYFYPSMNQDRHQVYLHYNLYSSTVYQGRSVLIKLTHSDLNRAYTEQTTVSPSYKNWTQVKRFNEYGDVILDKKIYYDNHGNELQQQWFNAEDMRAMGQAILYDKMGRPAISTLPALITPNPNLGIPFAYMPSFVAGAGSAPYNTNDFDKPYTTSLLAGEIFNPNVVTGSSAVGGLGCYYSTNNTDEPYVPTGSYPYYRVDYNDRISGGMTSVAGPADKMRMGQLKDVATVNMPVLWELNHYAALRPNFMTASCPALDMYNRATKTITRDANGVETVSFYSSEGLLLATAMSTGASSTPQTCATQYYIDQPYDGDMVLTGGYSSLGQFVDVYITGNDAPIFTGPCIQAGDAISWLPLGTNITIRSQYSFSYSDANTGYVASTSYSGLRISAETDIHITAGTSFTNSGAFTTYDLITGTVVSGTPLTGGYFRIKPTSGPITLSYTLHYSEFTYYYYDDAGRLIATVSPKGVNLASASAPNYTNTYTYNTLGQVLSMTTPDEGKTEYVYKKDGTLKFTQDAQQAADVKFAYTLEDNLYRTTESGIYTPTGSGHLYFQNHKDKYLGNTVPSGYVSIHTVLENVDGMSGGTDTDGIPDAQCSEQNWVAYDDADATLGTIKSGYTQRNTMGGAVKTWNANHTTWYSYDEEGRTEWTVSYLSSTQFNSTASNRAKTMHYQYNFAGRLLKTTYNKDDNTEIFDHFFTYDQAGRLKQVFTRAYTGKVQENAQYYHYLHGPTKRIELGENLQGLDYVYTIDGSLKAINHPALDNSDPGADSYTGSHSNFSQDVFGMMLEYYDQDYVRGTYYQTSANLTSLGYQRFYDGTIRAWTWNTRTSGTIPTPAEYAFSYDKKYQLLTATFGSWDKTTRNFTAATNNVYGSGMSYDANGNILTKMQLQQTGTAGSGQNDSYAFVSNTNKLSSTTGSVYSTTSRSFTYDASGRMISYVSNVAAETKYIEYDGAGLVKKVYKNAAKTQPLVAYEYDEAGQRIRKINYNQTTYVESQYTWYIRDAAGTVVSIYETDVTTSATTLKEQQVYGLSRIASYYRQLNDYQYELKDHLGNVRATVHKLGNGTLEVLSYADYDPWGEELPGRQLVSSPECRYGYQGEFAEKNAETNWNSFDLRMYDPILGRFISPDPYGQYHSPYMAMGNNPVNQIDPDGGFSLGGGVAQAGTALAKKILSETALRSGINTAIVIPPRIGATNILAGNIGRMLVLSSNGEYTIEGRRLEPANVTTAYSGYNYKRRPLWLEIVHVGLDIGGVVPLIGEVSDGINAGIYLIEGDNVNAAISLGCAVPVVGWAVLGGKYTAKGVKALKTAKLAKGAIITSKIAKQMGRRGWTVDLIDVIITKPFTTRTATNRATGNAATAYFDQNGTYVVVDNVTNEVIQISNRLDPNWIPDATIVDPYIP